MIHLFPASFVTSGAKAGYARLTFEVDDNNREMIEKINNSPMGKPFLIVAYEIGEDVTEISNLHNNKNSNKQNLMKQLHGIMGEYSAETGVSEEKIKTILRSFLKGKKIVKSSMSELDEQGLATAIYSLRVYLNPKVFDYSEYLKDDGKED